MIVHSQTLFVDAPPECGILDITAEVDDTVRSSGVSRGTVTLFNVGSTAAITTVEYEPGLVRDLQEFYRRLVPVEHDYHHEQMWHDGNGFSHVRAALLKPGLVVPVEEGRMRLGTWQQIVVINFDNRARKREIAVQIMGVSEGSQGG